MAEPPLLDVLANVQQSGRFYNVGGYLRASRTGLEFEPRGTINRWNLRRSLHVPFAAVQAIEITGRRGSPFAGAGRRRLRLRLFDGTSLTLVAREVDQLQEELERLRADDAE